MIKMLGINRFDQCVLNIGLINLKHPVIRDYPSGWENKLNQFLDHTIRYEALPNLVGYVDQTLNPDYRPPGWDEVHLTAKGFAGV
jgi:hypothetical protein